MCTDAANFTFLVLAGADSNSVSVTRRSLDGSRGLETKTKTGLIDVVLSS